MQLPLLIFALAAVFAVGVAPCCGGEPLTRAAEVRTLPGTETAKARPVRLRGVVTQRAGGAFVLQDDSAGIYVNVGLATRRGIWKGSAAELAKVLPGALVEVEGVTDRGGFSPPILPGTLRVVGEAPLPPARPMVPARFFSGVEDCQRIEVRGVVQGGLPAKGKASILFVNANPGSFEAELRGTAKRDLESLVDAEVKLTGVVFSRFNTRGEFLFPLVVLNEAADLVVEKTATSGSAPAPRIPLADIARFRTAPLNGHRLWVEGTVVAAGPGELLFLQEGKTGVRARVRRGDPVQVGDQVEVAGFLDTTREIRGLAEAVVRKIGRGTLEPPLVITPREILAINSQSAETGLIAQPSDFDGLLIRFQARLVDWLASPNGRHRLLLSTESDSVLATLTEEKTHALDDLRVGSLLEVTGIALLAYESGIYTGKRTVPTRVEVLLRSRDDLAVLQAPSWWTRRRIIFALTGLALALVASALWVWLLRRRVKVQAVQLAEEMRARREGLVEFQATLRERNRLAANLHDTLLQSVGGIGFQLDACLVGGEQGDAARGAHLEVARRMVDHAVGELRGSVWALRALPLDGRAFPEALRALARHVAQGHAAEVEVTIADGLPDVPELLAGNLLLVTQEALHNALKHGRPSRVEISARPHGAGLEVTIHDDGAGFTPGTEQGPAQGHFGVAGMKERVDRLGGSLQITSAPGAGTTIRAQVPLEPPERAAAG